MISGLVRRSYGMWTHTSSLLPSLPPSLPHRSVRFDCLPDSVPAERVLRRISISRCPPSRPPSLPPFPSFSQDWRSRKGGREEGGREGGTGRRKKGERMQLHLIRLSNVLKEGEREGGREGGLVLLFDLLSVPQWRQNQCHTYKRERQKGKWK